MSSFSYALESKADHPARKSGGGSKKAESSTAPVFLRKTFKMIDNSDPAIAGWSDGGTTFVVKQPEKFAAEVIPEWFKHNNFSSFVRQLNFYGFRKIKSDPLRIRDAEMSEESKFWKFRHEKFIQGREDLLVEIKKANQSESADKQEVEGLKQQVKSLQEELGSVQAQTEEMRGLIETLMANGSATGQQQQQVVSAHNLSPFGGKKRKFHESLSSPSSKTDRTMPFAFDIMDPFPISNNEDFLPVVPPPGDIPPSMPRKQVEQERKESTCLTSVTSHEEAIFSNLFDCLEDGPVPECPSSSISFVSNNHCNNPRSADPVAEVKVCSALARLPKYIQNVFAERLVAFVCNPDALNAQANALMSLAETASKEVAQQQYMAPESIGSTTNEEMGAAVLEAYLSNKCQIPNGDVTPPTSPAVSGNTAPTPNITSPSTSDSESSQERGELSPFDSYQL